MREMTKTIYQAFDGTSFDTAAECRTYEKEHSHLALVGLTLEQVEAALNRTDTELGDVIEAVAYRIRQTRMAAGDLKRERRKPEAAVEPVQIVSDCLEDSTTPVLEIDREKEAQLELAAEPEIPENLRRSAAETYHGLSR